MTQQISPFLEAKYGWSYGESGWNGGMDENLLKFSFMFDRNVDDISATLPPPTNGASVYLTTDNRLYFAVGTTWYSCPAPKWGYITRKSSGELYQFDGTTLNQVDSNAVLQADLDLIELTIASLGTAAYQNTEYFAEQSELDIVAAQASNYTDDLRNDLASATGTDLVGYNVNGSIVRTAKSKILESSVSVKDFGAVGDGVTDDTAAINAAVVWCRSNKKSLRFPSSSGSYLISSTIVLGSDTLTSVNVVGDNSQWMGLETIVVEGNFDGALFSASGISSLYCTAPYISGITLRNLNTGTSACAVRSDYSGGLRLEYVAIEHCNYGVYSAAELISPMFIEVTMVTPLSLTPGSVGVAGYKLAARNAKIIGGRVYSQQVCLDYSGDVVTVYGLNCEFSQVIFRHGSLASAVFVGCHFETSQVLLTNADSLPIDYESNWLDNAAQGSGISGSVQFIGGVCYLDTSRSNLVVIKDSPSFTYSLDITGMAINHPNKIVGRSFAKDSKVALPPGTKVRLVGNILDCAYPLSDIYSGFEVETGAGGTRYFDKLRVNSLRSGVVTTSPIIPVGGYIDIPTGLGALANAVFSLAWRGFSASSEYTAVVQVVQAYNIVTFGTRVSASLSSSDADWSLSWVSGAIRLTNNSTVDKTVVVNLQVKDRFD